MAIYRRHIQPAGWGRTARGDTVRPQRRKTSQRLETNNFSRFRRGRHRSPQIFDNADRFFD